MKQASSVTQSIDVAALRVGMFVHLDVGWMAHPFPLSSFRIASDDQLATIRGLGLQRVRWNPVQSDAALSAPAVLPAALPVLPAAAPLVAAAPASAVTAAAPAEPAGAVQQRRQALAQQNEQLRVCEQQFAEAAHATRQIFDLVEAQPQAAAAQAQALTGALVTKMCAERELCIRLLPAGAGAQAAAHAVNVGVVSLLLGRTLGLDEADLCDLGTGALLHDVGKGSLPAALRHRHEGMSPTELRGYEDHVARGVLHARKMGLSEGATMVIAQHHEHVDGSGFPLHLNADRMTVAARIVALVNRYDKLCNPPVSAQAHTPHEAVALLFSQAQNRYDNGLLGAFIRMVGVYPPGSSVQLTDSRYALVVGVNSSRPLKPRVLVHEPGVPREEALVVDLERQQGLGVLRSIKPQSLPARVFEYLAPSARVSYFFEPAPEPVC